jgi:hypothetical protein
VQRNKFTRLASRSFRNILLRMESEEFEEFADSISENWPELRIGKPSMPDYSTKELVMNYEENRIPREVYWSGFGFQVWMQMMLQIRRCGENSILVLDEPEERLIKRVGFADLVA